MELRVRDGGREPYGEHLHSHSGVAQGLYAKPSAGSGSIEFRSRSTNAGTASNPGVETVQIHLAPPTSLTFNLSAKRANRSAAFGGTGWQQYLLL
jgi:hypothetical protein